MLPNGLYSITFRAGQSGPTGSGVIVLRDSLNPRRRLVTTL